MLYCFRFELNIRQLVKKLENDAWWLYKVESRACSSKNWVKLFDGQLGGISFKFHILIG